MGEAFGRGHRTRAGTLEQGSAVFPWIPTAARASAGITSRAVPPTPGNTQDVGIQVADTDGNVYTLVDGEGNDVLATLVDEGGVSFPSTALLFSRWRYSMQSPSTKPIVFGGTFKG